MFVIILLCFACCGYPLRRVSPCIVGISDVWDAMLSCWDVCGENGGEGTLGNNLVVH
jgi:hypothetical protein